ncbi:hypothetical protein M432DRAFT_636168 [Thermoascus aurantiacus ATCC 26904]
MATASIVTFSGLRCTKVRRTTRAPVSTSTSSSNPPIETSSGNQATPISSPIKTQVSTASDPAPQPGVSPSTTTTAISSPSATGQTTITSPPDTAGGTNDATGSFPSATSTSSPFGPVGVSSSGGSSQNSSGKSGDGGSQQILGAVVGAMLGAVAILTVASFLLFRLRRRRRRRRGRRPEDTIDFYATEKSQRDSPETLETQGLSGLPASSGNADRKEPQSSDQPAQLESLPKATIRDSAAGPPEWLSADPQQSQRDRFSTPKASSQLLRASDPFADPKPTNGQETSAEQYRLSFPQSAFEGLDFDLPPTGPAQPRSAEPEDGRNENPVKAPGHDREDSTSSSIIVLPGRSSFGSSLYDGNYYATAADLARWRQERDKFTRASTRSDPFDLERPLMTTYTIARPSGGDIRWGSMQSTDSDMTLCSPVKEDDR